MESLVRYRQRVGVGLSIWSALRVIVVVFGDRRRPQDEEEFIVKYFVLLASFGELPAWDDSTVEEQESQMAQLGAFGEACAARPGVEIVSEGALGDGSTATTLRTRSGELTVTDGPFAEAAEQIGGYYVLEAPELDTVLELCKILPAYDIDIRPV